MPGGGLLGLLGQASGIAAFVTAILGIAYVRSTNAKNRAEAREREANAAKSGNEGGKFDAEAQKLGVEGEVAMSGTWMQWAQRADTRAATAEAAADAAREQAREANERADECRRDRDNDRILLNDLRREFDQLLERIASCPAGTICPVADSLTTRHQH